MNASTNLKRSLRIAFLVPGDQSGPCGVTDYSLWLSRAAAERGHQVLMLSLYPFQPRDFMSEALASAGGTITTPMPSQTPTPPEEIAQALASFGPDLVILQFSPPVFRTGKRIYPYLSRICRALRPYRVFLVVHETWTTSETHVSCYRSVLHAVRRFEILTAWKWFHPRHVYASNTRHVKQLRSAGLSPHHLPIFSNIPPAPRASNPRSNLEKLLATRGETAFLPDVPFIAIFFGRIPECWDPEPVLRQIKQEARGRERDLCLISIGETGYSNQGWENIRQAAASIPSLRLGRSSPEEIITLIHAANCGITPNPLSFWLKSGTCAAMVGCELPLIFSQTDIPEGILLPPCFATLGQQQLTWHHPEAERVAKSTSPHHIWQRMEQDLLEEITLPDFKPTHRM